MRRGYKSQSRSGHRSLGVAGRRQLSKTTHKIELGGKGSYGAKNSVQASLSTLLRLHVWCSKSAKISQGPICLIG
jgi:hypothetical protein